MYSNIRNFKYLGYTILFIDGLAVITGCKIQDDVEKKPNFILIFTDDQGYADVGAYGATGYQTPYLDQMAAEGIRFTDFYVASSVCSPSRAALMTGCYSQNVGLPEVLDSWSGIGISSDETTIAEIFKSQGYNTAIYGKWHLGHHPEFLPTRHGFDEFFGIPYSNDMWPFHPTKPDFFPDLPLLENEMVLEYNSDQSKFTTQFTERTVDFIRKNKNEPFFIYLAHVMPHVPLFVSDKFEGKSEMGLYGDVIMEIDWSVGQILQALKEEGLDENTIVVFTSDNGPWLSYGDHGGSAGPLRDGKTTTFDGGMRVPAIMRWPGNIPAGEVCREIATTMDLLPTFANLIKAPLPEKPIDGKDIWPLMSGQPDAVSPHEAFFYYDVWKLDAVRSGNWKLHLPRKYYTSVEPGSGGLPGTSEWSYIDLALFDLKNDIGEQHDLSFKHPEIVDRLLGYAQKARFEIGDAELKVDETIVDYWQSRKYFRIRGINNREPGRINQQ